MESTIRSSTILVGKWDGLFGSALSTMALEIGRYEHTERPCLVDRQVTGSDHVYTRCYTRLVYVSSCTSARIDRDGGDNRRIANGGNCRCSYSTSFSERIRILETLHPKPTAVKVCSNSSSCSFDIRPSSGVDGKRLG